MNNIKMAKGLEIRSNTERVAIENNIVSGSTEKCDNLFDPKLLTDISVTAYNKYVTIDKDGTININNTTTTTIYLTTKFVDIETATYYFKKFDVNISDYAIFIQTNGSRSYANILNEPKSVSVTNSFAFTIRVGPNKSGTLKIMVSKNSTAATTFQPYFEGLRYGYYKGLQLDKWSYIDKTNKIKHIGGTSYTFTGNEVWTQSNTALGDYRYSCNVLVDLIQRPIDSAHYTNAIMADLDSSTGTQNYNGQEGFSFGYASGVMYVYKANVQTSNDMALYMSGKTIDFQIATPSESGIEEF